MAKAPELFSSTEYEVKALQVSVRMSPMQAVQLHASIQASKEASPELKMVGSQIAIQLGMVS